MQFLAFPDCPCNTSSCPCGQQSLACMLCFDEMSQSSEGMRCPAWQALQVFVIACAPTRCNLANVAIIYTAQGWTERRGVSPSLSQGASPASMTGRVFFSRPPGSEARWTAGDVVRTAHTFSNLHVQGSPVGVLVARLWMLGTCEVLPRFSTNPRHCMLRRVLASLLSHALLCLLEVCSVCHAWKRLTTRHEDALLFSCSSTRSPHA
jgi:hypothetical protein